MSNVRTVPLFAWRPQPELGVPGFVVRYGHVEYRRVMAQKNARLEILARSSCEVDPRHTENLVFDHCHDHGWVRGIVCHACNVKLGQIDAARKLDGILVVPGNTEFGRIIASCPGGIENIRSWMLKPGPFAPPLAIERPGVSTVDFVVGRGYVHARFGDRTVCDLPASSARLATTQARYCTACSRIVPRSTWEWDVRDRHARGLITSYDDDDPEAA